MVIDGDGILVSVWNPAESLRVKDTSVCLGALIGDHHDWWRTGAIAPDGSYALFRSDAHTVEMCSDMVASRTVWYVCTNEILIASTSQRAIVFMLKNFVPNPSVYPWMLSSGTLGLGGSWDKRIQCIPGNARLVLHRASWQLQLTKQPVMFEAEDASEAEHKRRLRHAFEDSIDQLEVDFQKWAVLLSGGFESRAILLAIKNHANLKTVTWGLSAAVGDKASDAYVARSVARYLGVANEYYETDFVSGGVERVFRRFVMASEGRIDHITGYADGCEIWRRLHESGITGVIRGDFATVRKVCTSERVARFRNGLRLINDYMELRFEGPQALPESLHRRMGESLSTYRDRVYLEFRLPVVMAALNGIKSCYVEVANPLCSKRIIDVVRRLPDYLRDHKRAWHAVAKSVGPDLPYASARATAYGADILGSPEAVNFLGSEIDQNGARELFSNGFIDWVRAGMVAKHRSYGGGKKVPLRKAIGAMIPRTVKERIRGRPAKFSVNCNLLAFRIFLTSEMHSTLSADAALGRDCAQFL